MKWYRMLKDSFKEAENRLTAALKSVLGKHQELRTKDILNAV